MNREKISLALWRTAIFFKLANSASAICILAIVVWGLVRGAGKIDVMGLPMWVFIGTMVGHLVAWSAWRLVRPAQAEVRDR